MNNKPYSSGLIGPAESLSAVYHMNSSIQPHPIANVAPMNTKKPLNYRNDTLLKSRNKKSKETPLPEWLEQQIDEASQKYSKILAPFPERLKDEDEDEDEDEEQAAANQPPEGQGKKTRRKKPKTPKSKRPKRPKSRGRPRK